MPIVRVCAAVVRADTILMVRHGHDGRSYWTLPGGGVQAGETPEEAVLRELQEEARLEGRVGARLYQSALGDHGVEVCFAVDVDAVAEAGLGVDPELPSDGQMLMEVGWRPFAELADDVQVARVLSVFAARRREQLP